MIAIRNFMSLEQIQFNLITQIAAMRKIYTLLAALTLFNLATGQQLDTGIETIIVNKFYVVHSMLAYNGSLSATSNIYLIKGKNDTVWVFGSGYGDKTIIGDTSDVQYYKSLITNGVMDPLRNAIDDATQADTVIRFKFNLSPASAKLMLIVPHFHPDHINKEFVSAFFQSLGYIQNKSKIFVHINDSSEATCNAKCCGEIPCSFNSLSYGAPYNDPWTNKILKMFRAFGNPLDVCNQPVKTLNSASGKWVIVKSEMKINGGHTDGTVNIDNNVLKYRILGASAGVECDLPDPSWKALPIHGNLPDLLSEKKHQSNLSTNAFAYPNPSNGIVTIQTVEEVSDASIAVYNVYGDVVLELQHLSGNRFPIDFTHIEQGMYLYRMAEYNSLWAEGKIVVK